MELGLPFFVTQHGLSHTTFPRLFCGLPLPVSNQKGAPASPSPHTCHSEDLVDVPVPSQMWPGIAAHVYLSVLSWSLSLLQTLRCISLKNREFLLVSHLPQSVLIAKFGFFSSSLMDG